MTLANGAAVIRRETERDYLDAEIGKALLGEPKHSLIEAAAELGDITRSGVWMAERRVLIKLGADGAGDRAVKPRNCRIDGVRLVAQLDCILDLADPEDALDVVLLIRNENARKCGLHERDALATQGGGR